jgi:hypothetical protein
VSIPFPARSPADHPFSRRRPRTRPNPPTTGTNARKKRGKPLDDDKNASPDNDESPMRTTPNARKPRTADEGRGRCPGEYHPAVRQLTQLIATSSRSASVETAKTHRPTATTREGRCPGE